MRYWERGTEVCGGACRIGHLVHVAILAPHWSGVLAKYLCIWYALNTVGGGFIQRKALGLHWYLNPAIFSTTHTQPYLYHLCLFDNKVSLSKRTQPCMSVGVDKSRSPVYRIYYSKNWNIFQRQTFLIVVFNLIKNHSSYLLSILFTFWIEYIRYIIWFESED